MSNSESHAVVPATKSHFPEAIERLTHDGGHPEAHVLRIVARSPATVAASEVMERLAELHANGIEVQAVFLKIPENGPGSAALRHFAEIYGSDHMQENVRVAGFTGAGDMLEQINFGRVGVWTGRPLRTSRTAPPEKGMYVDTQSDARLANMARGAFVSAWAISDRMTEKELRKLGARTSIDAKPSTSAEAQRELVAT